MAIDFNKITDTVAEIEFADDTARDLLVQMDEYATKYARSFGGLMRVPAFAKLWRALEEAAIYSGRGDRDSVPASIAKRHGLDKVCAEMED